VFFKIFDFVYLWLDPDVEDYINKSKFVNLVVEDLVSLYNSLPSQLTSNDLKMDEYIKHIHFINSTSKFSHNVHTSSH
jgi:hypothetical protein